MLAVSLVKLRRCLRSERAKQGVRFRAFLSETRSLLSQSCGERKLVPRSLVVGSEIASLLSFHDDDVIYDLLRESAIIYEPRSITREACE